MQARSAANFEFSDRSHSGWWMHSLSLSGWFSRFLLSHLSCHVCQPFELTIETGVELIIAFSAADAFSLAYFCLFLRMYFIQRQCFTGSRWQYALCMHGICLVAFYKPLSM